MIELKDINIRFEKEIVRDINLKISDNEFISIIGRSGCGKTVLLKYILNNTNIKEIGYMAQNDLLFEWYTVYQNILLPLKINNKKINIDSYLSIFGLLEYKDMTIDKLSGGLKSRVALLRAYLTSSSLMLLDEPFSKLDYITHMKLMAWMKTVIKDKSVFLVTHNIDEAIFLSDKIIVLGNNPTTIVMQYEVKNFEKEDLKKHIIMDLGT